MNMRSASKFLSIAAVLLVAQSAVADALLKLPNFEALANKATKVVNITLDANLLGLAGRFLDSNDPEDAAAKELIAGLKGVYVRSYEFDTDFAYPKADVDSVRKQLGSPGWQQLVQVRSRKEHQDVDVYILIEQNRATGLAIIASEPREFTIINIVGAIDLQKLHRLEGQFGIPKLDLEEKKSGK